LSTTTTATTLHDPAITSTSKTILDFGETREEDPFLKPEDAESRKEKCGRILGVFYEELSIVRVGVNLPSLHHASPASVSIA
jgi:hypothetical protein